MERPKRHEWTRLGFLAFLLLSPLLPYMIVIPYNHRAFVSAAARVKSLPAYPGAVILDETVVRGTPPNLCQEWGIRYETTATGEQIGAFYASALREQGWQWMGETGTVRYYRSATSRLQLIYEEDGMIIAWVTARLHPIFGLGC